MADSRQESVSTVKWSGDVLADSALRCKEDLLKAFASSDRVLLDLSACTQIDVAAIQLIVASYFEASKTGKHFSVVEPVPAEIGQALELAGLDLRNLESGGGM